jgi:diguanylate cyclase (GGDEF)-like protein
MAIFEAYLTGRSKTSLTILGILTVFLVGAVDYLTGPEISFSIFYLLPIFVVAWYTRKDLGIGIALLSAIVWLTADLIGGHVYSHSVIGYWNAAVRLGIFLVVALLVSKIRETLEEERELARKDGLTNAANVRFFYEILEAERRRAERYNRPFTVAYLDIDNFKVVNDRHGHRAGDELLLTVVNSIRGNIRSTDAVGRLGGDEFALLLPETDAGSARVVVHKVRDSLLETVRKKEYPVTFSIGVMTYVKPPASINEILHETDKLMYSVKTGGKDGIHHEVM